MPPISSESRHKNRLAGDWMHKGIDLLGERSPDALEQAVRCFDEAITLRGALPLDENHFFRYGLSAGWINRGDALARLGGSRHLTQAVKSYDEALTLLESLPLEENELYPRRLAITWINRGMALQRRNASNDTWEAVECFREAIGVLEHPSAIAIADRPSLAAGAWINLGGALIGSARENPQDVRLAARRALVLVQRSERSEIVSVEIGLKARHLLCRLAVRDIADKKTLSKGIVAEATDAVDEAMALLRHWKFQGQAELAKLSLELFRFGCRIYENSQLHFLAEFLSECLAPELFGETILTDQETLNAADAAIWGVLDKLQLDGFRFVSTPEFEPFMEDIRGLKRVEEKLTRLRLANWAA